MSLQAAPPIASTLQVMPILSSGEGYVSGKDPRPFFRLMDAKRSMEGQRMAHGILHPVRGDRVDLAQLFQGVFQRHEPFGVDAVVVRDQNDHSAILADYPKGDKLKGKNLRPATVLKSSVLFGLEIPFKEN